MRFFNSVRDLVGDTPLVKIHTFGDNSEIFGKCEFMNPLSSIKDRVALNILKNGIERRDIDSNTLIIEATSGNTGIGLSAIGASLGLKVAIVMPDSMSIERIALMKQFGAKVILTPAKLGMAGAVAEAEKLAEENPNSFLTSQFSNSDNPEAHETTTAEEIWRDTDGKIDIFLSAVGTGGTLSGVGKYLKERNPNIQIIAVEPESSPVLSGGTPAPHKIQGIGAGFIPDNLNRDIYDEVITVSDSDALQTARELAQKEGLLVGISSGANIYASKVVGEREENQGKVIVTTLNDTGERYISTELFKK